MLLSLSALLLAAEPDWSTAGAETVQNLAAYLQVDTTNPPGNELRGAQFLADLLAKEGITSEIDEFAPGRANLIARLPGSGQEKPLCLISHIDVVTAEPQFWEAGKGPLSGTIVDGFVYGRGALDMKGMGMLETMVLIQLKRQAVPLRRDVILLAVADEEVGSLGMERVVDTMWDRIGCSHSVNEGGLGIQDLMFEGQTAWAISVAEKGVLWARIVASGEPGHGSTPRPGQAPERLHAAIEALGKYKAKPNISVELYEFLKRVGAERGGALKGLLANPGMVRTLLTGRLMGTPTTRAGITDTLNVTGYGGANEPNVVPSEVWANLDCRLQPGTTPAQMLARLQELTKDVPGIRYEVISEKEANRSPWQDPFFDALAEAMTEGKPGHVAGPVLSVGFTDSLFLRPLGVHAYGIVPFSMPQEEMKGMHGHAERVSVENVENGLRKLYRAVLKVSAS